MLYKLILVLSSLFLCLACATASPESATPQEEFVSNQITSRYDTEEPTIINFHRMNDNLYRSGRLTPENVILLAKKYGIKSIISLETYVLADHVRKEEERASQYTGIKFIHIPMRPITHFNKEKMLKAIEYMKDPSNLPTLVHCFRGSDRTGMIIAGYRITVEGWSREEAISEMEKYGFSPLFASWKKSLPE